MDNDRIRIMDFVNETLTKLKEEIDKKPADVEKVRLLIATHKATTQTVLLGEIATQLLRIANAFEEHNRPGLAQHQSPPHTTLRSPASRY